jgi:isochorismate hydrolase
MYLKDEYLSIRTLNDDISLIYDPLITKIHKAQIWNATPLQSALLVTDLQNYFLSPKSHAFIPSAPAILNNIRSLIQLFHKLERPVIFTKHINNKENADSMDYWWNDLIREENSLSEIHDGMHSSKDTILVKHQYDAFHKTELEILLKSNHVIFPVICGVMTNLCCETTVRSAFVKGFRPVLPVDATAAYNREFHVATFQNLAFGFSPLMKTDDILNKLDP